MNYQFLYLQKSDVCEPQAGRPIDFSLHLLTTVGGTPVSGGGFFSQHRYAFLREVLN